MSTFAFLLVVLSAVLHAGWNFTAKRYAHSSAVLFLGLLFAFAVLIVPATAIALSTDPRSLVSALPYVVVSGLFQALYCYFLFKGYRHHDISSLYPIARGIGIGGVALVSVTVFQDSISPLGYASLALIMAGVVLVGFVSKGAGSWRLLRDLTALLPLFVGLTIIGYTLIDKAGIQIVHPVLYITGMLFFNLLFLLPLKAWKQNKLREAWQHQKVPSAIIGIGSISTYLIILFVFQLTTLSYVVALRELSVALGAVLGILILKEQWNYAKVIGIVCIVIGAIALKSA